MKITELINSVNPYEKRLTKPLIIAEAGVNHEGSLDLAKRLVDEAKEGGADVIKFQTYKAESLASKDSPSYWDRTKEPTASQYELFKKHDSFWKNEMVFLKEYCDKAAIEFLSTPFDVESAEFLNDLMNVYKISSSEITNRPFIDYICSFNKPVILSTGASYLWEIQEAVSWIEEKGNSLALLHCVLNYPTDDKNANLGMILELKEKFPDKIIGYSDHTLPKEMKACELAVYLGCSIIEKHFTFDKTLPGNDHYHAADKEDLKLLRRKLENGFELLGSFKVSSLESEETSRLNARRSLVAAAPIKKGEVIKRENLTFKRPAFGVSPKYIEDVVGRTAKEDISNDDVIKWTMLE